jgi:hypothetical protein
MKVARVTPLNGHKLEVVFADGKTIVVSLANRLFGPIFEPLRDERLFTQVQIDEFGVICWPNGADLAPDALSHLAQPASEPSPARR